MPRAFDERQRAAIDTALKRAALEAMQAGGMRSCSVASLCRAAGISKGAFYGFYPSKEALVIGLLREAETELRGELTACLHTRDPLRAVLTRMFEAVSTHPLLALLASPEDFAWLSHSLPPEVLAEAREDDVRWFGQLRDELIARRALDPNVPAAVFTGLPNAALALAQGERLIGESAPGVRDLIVDALVRRLRT